ncbi:hypothetical protein L1049_000730 [Liquidambar formosana]|uniref:Uncharacterized protein n=1 Tax=Liquidambar formosana TaxID=63359 RepID=A0AAP0R5K7_LIQFO
MFFSKEVEDLHDDGFEGSNDEHRIFTEVFFGNETVGTSKRCLVTGVINFECEYNKHADTSRCSNSENSAVTSQSSSKEFYVEDPFNAHEDVRGASGPGCSLERFTYDHDVNAKRMKLIVGELPNSKPDLGKVSNSSVPLKEVVSGTSCPAFRLCLPNGNVPLS